MSMKADRTDSVMYVCMWEDVKQPTTIKVEHFALNIENETIVKIFQSSNTSPGCCEAV